MTLTERAMGEWLDQSVSGLTGEALLAKLGELAPQISLSPQRAADIYRRYRYEQRFAERHHEVSRKYGVSESSYSPDAIEQMIDTESVQEKTGWTLSAGGVSDPSRWQWSEGAADRSKAQSLAQSTAALLEYLQPGMLKHAVRWKFWKWRVLHKDEKAVQRVGSGETIVEGVAVSWLLRAVMIVRNGQTVEVFPETKLRRVWMLKSRSKKLKKKGRPGNRRAQLERLEIVGEELNYEEMCRRFAAMLRLYKGSASGWRSQVHLAAAARVTKQAVSDMELRMKQYYERRTGGRAHFEKVSGEGPAKRINGSKNKKKGTEP